jgi:hypothetical protein
LKEVAEAAGGMDYSAVSEAIRYLELKRRKVQQTHDRVLRILNLET